MKKHIKVYDSYRVWSPRKMFFLIDIKNRKPSSRDKILIVLEWWTHNIGYYLTKPFSRLKFYNLRFRDVDLMIEDRG